MKTSTDPWVGVKWAYFIRGSRNEVILQDGRVKEGPKWAKGKMIEKVIETVKQQGGSLVCLGVSSTGRKEKRKELVTAPRENTKKSSIRSRM